MKKFLGSLAAAGLVMGTSFAGSLTVANSNIEMSGAVTAGYFYVTNEGAGKNNDYFTVSNFSVGLKSKDKGFIGFVSYFGDNTWDGLLGRTKNKFKVKYAWLSINPMKGLTIDAGILTTNIGYELYHSYQNLNYTFGMVWNAQPVTYPGARVTYSVAEGIDVYAEYNQDTTFGQDDSFALGSIGSVGGIDYAVSYYDGNATRNLIDVVLSYALAGTDVGLNLDYHWLDDAMKTAGKDDTAYGVALFINPAVAPNVTVPVRVEYINQGTSDIYAYDGKSIGESAYSVTVTPTYKPTDNTYIRCEFAYVTTDKAVFADDKGNSKDSKTFVGFEAGFMF
ncbi:outer membrane beta-barrel protein [Persephonella sp.]